MISWSLAILAACDQYDMIFIFTFSGDPFGVALRVGNNSELAEVGRYLGFVLLLLNYGLSFRNFILSCEDRAVGSNHVFPFLFAGGFPLFNMIVLRISNPAALVGSLEKVLQVFVNGPRGCLRCCCP